MRTFLKIILVFALSIFSSGNLFAYTIDDLTDVGKGRTSDSAENHLGMTDVLGANGYNTYGIDVGFSGYVMTLDFFTRFDGIDLVGGVSIELADIFFDSGSGDYDYAVDMGDNKIYSDVTLYRTSEDNFQGISGGPWYYGRYWGTDATAPSPIVERLNGAYVSDLLSSSWSLSSEIYKYTVSFDVRDIGVNLGDSFEIFWATASCANDIIEGTINTPVPVPEPATMLLLGTGLIGMAGIGRKKFKK